MIFYFDNDIQTANNDQQKKAFADLIVYICNNNHYVKCDTVVSSWIDTNIFNTKYLAQIDIDIIKQCKMRRDITQELINNLSTVHIGISKGISPSDALRLFQRASRVIVENGANDWAVICKWIDLMKKDRYFKNINAIVCERKDSKLLDQDNAGTCGQVIKHIDILKKNFGVATKYKVSLVIDSDKHFASDTLTNEKLNIIKKMKAENIDGHILHKREMENYFPLSLYKEAGMTHNNCPEPTDTWDYIDVENANYIKYKKNQLPDLTKWLDKKALLKCVGENTASNPNEIQEIILKLAKIC